MRSADGERTVKPRIVVVDADQMSARVLRFALEDEGLAVVVVGTAAEAIREIVGRETSLAILESALPDASGLALCRELRAQGYAAPLIFMSRDGSLNGKVEAFRAGADDYIVKPFEPVEFLARATSMIRRWSGARQEGSSALLRVGDATLSIAHLTYSSDVARDVLLTPTEMRLLDLLMRQHGVTIGRDDLIRHVWGLESLDDTNRVDVFVRRLRRKIERDVANPRYLHTVRGQGYYFSTPGKLADDRPDRPIDGRPEDRADTLLTSQD